MLKPLIQWWRRAWRGDEVRAAHNEYLREVELTDETITRTRTQIDIARRLDTELSKTVRQGGGD